VDVLAHHAYYELRGAMLGFLADQDKRHHAPAKLDPAVGPVTVPDLA